MRGFKKEVLWLVQFKAGFKWTILKIFRGFCLEVDVFIMLICLICLLFYVLDEADEIDLSYDDDTDIG